MATEDDEELERRKQRALRHADRTGKQPCITPGCITPVTSGWYCDRCVEKGRAK